MRTILLLIALSITLSSCFLNPCGRYEQYITITKGDKSFKTCRRSRAYPVKKVSKKNHVIFHKLSKKRKHQSLTSKRISHIISA